MTLGLDFADQTAVVNFFSLLMSHPQRSHALELRYFINSSGDRLIDKLDTGLGTIAITQEVLLSERHSKELRASHPVLAPGWLRPFAQARYVDAEISASDSFDNRNVPQELLSFARTRHPWIMRDPLGYLDTLLHLHR